MKKIKFVLPLVMLMSISSCAGNVNRETSKGNVPEGGTLLADKEAKNAALLASLNKTRESLDNLNEAGITIASEGLGIELASTNVNGNISIGSFALSLGASNLSNGTKDNTKLGLDFSGLTNAINLTTTKGDETESLVQENNIGKFGVYLEKGNLYADLSEFGAPELISSGASKVQEYLPLVAESDLVDAETLGMVSSLLGEFNENPDNVTQTVGLFFGCLKDFNWKMAINDVLKDEDYPLVSSAELMPIENDEAALEELKEEFNAYSGLDFDETINVYQYSNNALALQLDINKDQLNDILAQYLVADFDYTINEGALKFAVYFNENGIPTSLSLVNNMDFTISGEEVQAMFYSESVNVKTNIDLSLTLSLGSNPVSFPSSYSDYNSFNPLIASLA